MLGPSSPTSNPTETILKPLTERRRDAESTRDDSEDWFTFDVIPPSPDSQETSMSEEPDAPRGQQQPLELEHKIAQLIKLCKLYETGGQVEPEVVRTGARNESPHDPPPHTPLPGMSDIEHRDVCG